MRPPDPGRQHRRRVDALPADQPALLVRVDRFEPPVQRPQARAEADTHDSGKQQARTRTSQVAINEITGKIAAVADSVPGPTADITLLKQSTPLERLPGDVGVGGDLAYVGADKLHPIRIKLRRSGDKGALLRAEWWVTDHPF